MSNAQRATNVQKPVNDTPTAYPQILNEYQLLRQLPTVSRRWLRGEIREGRIPHLKAGRTRLFDLDAVKRSLADRMK